MVIPILLYHSISATSAPLFKRWAVHPDVFDAHVQCLRNNHYTPLTVTQLAAAIDSGSINTIQNPVVITFDDGFADFYIHAVPILKKHDVPATIYIVTGYIGDTSRWLDEEGEGERPMMTWDQVVEIDALGIECGAHTHTHPQLDILSKQTARDEITRSKMELEQHLGHDVPSFAYPHGYYNHAVREMVTQAGFSSACAVKHAMSVTNDDRYALGRIIISDDTTTSQLESWLAGQDIPLAQTRERLRTTVWRLVRRTRALRKKLSS